MPFTPSHAISVLPLPRRWFVLPALIVGSMTPDFEYLLRFSFQWRWGHSIPGIVFFDVPIGMLVLLLYFSLMQYPILLLTPEPLRKFIRPITGTFRFGPPARFMAILLSLAIGAFMHIAWDSFTHANGVAVRCLPFLSLQFAAIGDCRILACDVLQHISSAVGLTFIVLILFIKGRRAPSGAGEAPGIPPLRAILTITAITTAAFIVALTLHADRIVAISDFLALRNAAGSVSLTWMSIVTIAWMLLGVRSLSFMKALGITPEEYTMEQPGERSGLRSAPDRSSRCIKLQNTIAMEELKQ